jgi:hypothetical protein
VAARYLAADLDPVRPAERTRDSEPAGEELLRHPVRSASDVVGRSFGE